MTDGHDGASVLGGGLAVLLSRVTLLGLLGPAGEQHQSAPVRLQPLHILLQHPDDCSSTKKARDTLDERCKRHGKACPCKGHQRLHILLQHPDTMRDGSTANVPAKRMLKYCRISECHTLAAQLRMQEAMDKYVPAKVISRSTFSWNRIKQNNELVAVPGVVEAKSRSKWPLRGLSNRTE